MPEKRKHGDDPPPPLRQGRRPRTGELEAFVAWAARGLGLPEDLSGIETERLVSRQVPNSTRAYQARVVFWAVELERAVRLKGTDNPDRKRWVRTYLHELMSEVDECRRRFEADAHRRGGLASAETRHQAAVDRRAVWVEMDEELRQKHPRWSPRRRAYDIADRLGASRRQVYDFIRESSGPKK